MQRIWKTRRRLHFTPLALAIGLLAGSSAPAHAANCFVGLAACYQESALAPDWMSMWLQGLDCELSLTNCIRIAVFGR
jgi:hypothetical protein